MSLIFAFLMGGAICAAVQILIDKTALTPAKILVFFVVFGVFLGAVGIYEPLFEYFGCAYDFLCAILVCFNYFNITSFKFSGSNFIITIFIKW